MEEMSAQEAARCNAVLPLSTRTPFLRSACRRLFSTYRNIDYRVIMLGGARSAAHADALQWQGDPWRDACAPSSIERIGRHRHPKLTETQRPTFARFQGSEKEVSARLFRTFHVIGNKYAVRPRSSTEG
jgi:hypothetical protein